MKEHEKWFTHVSSIKVKGRKTPMMTDDEQKMWVEFAQLFARNMQDMCAHRLYTGKLRGSRTSLIKRIIKNIHYWLQKYEAYELHHVNAIQYKMDKDEYGNDIRRYIIDFTNYIISDSIKPLNGRILVHVFAELGSELIASKLKRWLVEHIPFVVNKLNDKYKSSFTVKMRIWFDRIHFVDIDSYKFDVIDKIVIPHTKPDDYEKGELNERARYFHARKSLSGI